ncbi:hypothetical protein B0H14DRAFT_208361 [Mycena olivaceomarginata]|nr:hypothetical protein B0H14DRAFT_208361 [Mycena olivaceomarginata]
MASTLPLLAHLSPPVSHWGKWANWLASLSDAEHDAFDVLKTQSEFKYRVWFTWRLVNFSLKGIENARTAARRQEQFWMAIAKMDPNEDLWLWEDEDEGYIKAFVEDHSSDWIPESSLEMSAFEWAHASQALEERPPQRPTVSPVSHLAAHTRLRFIAWLIVADVTPKDRLRLAGLEPLVRDWRLCIADSSTYSSCCGAPHCCGVSRNIWLETMLHVYSVDDLQSIPWYPEDSSLETCKCFQRQRVLPSGQFQAMQIHPGRNSAALRVLFELVVSPWPLILW